MLDSYIPLVIMVVVGGLFGLSNVILAEVLGPRRTKTKTKLSIYECGMEPITSARERFSVKFYMVAMLFILFDIEIVFMYPWAVQFKELGITGLVAMGFFMMLLFAGFIYVVKKGALKWD
ncbi:MAG: NADH-quinone oxidoreductase subunit A [Ignavibacteriae bacterium]|nr:NADH-quinone oxidoreductase subunit A [Ignavibacteriota bacterium]